MIQNVRQAISLDSKPNEGGGNSCGHSQDCGTRAAGLRICGGLPSDRQSPVHGMVEFAAIQFMVAVLRTIFVTSSSKSSSYACMLKGTRL